MGSLARRSLGEGGNPKNCSPAIHRDCACKRSAVPLTRPPCHTSVTSFLEGFWGLSRGCVVPVTQCGGWRVSSIWRKASMRNSFSRWCVLALLIVPLVSSTAWAQTFTGGVRGVVSDSGGVVPGVTVDPDQRSRPARRAKRCRTSRALQLCGGGPRRLHGQGGVDGFQDATRTKASASARSSS